jgi:hypothetical protein
MKNKLLLVASIILVLVVLVPSSVLATAPPSHLGQQNWQLNNNIIGSGVYEMGKNPGPNCNKPHSTVTISGHSNLIWIADQVSQGVTFPVDGPWVVELVTDSWDLADSTCTIQVGQWNGSVFSELHVDTIHSDFFSYPSSDTTATMIRTEFQLSDFTIPNGMWLAIKVTNNEDSIHIINTGASILPDSSASCVTSPSTDPGYPTPEVASIVLLGSGLIGLTGFGVFQYRKKRLSSINSQH